MANYMLEEILLPDHATQAPGSDLQAPFTVYNLNLNSQMVPHHPNFYCYEPDQSKGVRSSKVNIEDILKKNPHVWNAYSSGKFSVRDYYENSVRKIVLKEMNAHDRSQTGYNITKYRVRIRRGNDEDHILLVSFADAPTQNPDGTISTVPALPPPVITRQGDQIFEVSSQFNNYTTNSINNNHISHNNSSSPHAPSQGSNFSSSSPQPSTGTISNNQHNNHNTSINAAAEEFYERLTGPGSDLIERLVEGNYANSQSATIKPSSPVNDDQSQRDDHSENEVNETTIERSNQEATAIITEPMTGVQDSFDDEYITQYAPISHELMRRQSTYSQQSNNHPLNQHQPQQHQQQQAYHNQFPSGSVNNYQGSYASHPGVSTPASSASTYPLSKLGFPAAAGYTSAIISNSMYDSAALSASVSGPAYPIYGSTSVASGSVVYPPREKISSRLSGSVRRVLTEFEDDRANSRLSNYYNTTINASPSPKNNQQRAASQAQIHNLSTVVSMMDRSHQNSRLSDANIAAAPSNIPRSYSIGARSLHSNSNNNNYRGQVNYITTTDGFASPAVNPFAFGNTDIGHINNSNNSPVFNSAHSTPSLMNKNYPASHNTNTNVQYEHELNLERSRDESEYPGSTLGYESNGDIKMERHSVRKQFIRSGGESALRSSRREDDDNESCNTLTNEQVIFYF